MKITIEVTPEEVKELLQAIGSSKEQKNINVDLQSDIKKTSEELAKIIHRRRLKQH